MNEIESDIQKKQDEVDKDIENKGVIDVEGSKKADAKPAEEAAV